MLVCCRLISLTIFQLVVLFIPINNVYKTKNNIFPVIDHDKFNRFLYEEKWSEIYIETSVNECCNSFQKIINYEIDKSTSYTVITSKNKRLKERMSATILCSTRHKQALSLKFKQNSNNLKLALHYKKYKNNYTKILRLSKEKFYEKRFKSVSYNPKLTWQHINEVTGSITKCKEETINKYK